MGVCNCYVFRCTLLYIHSSWNHLDGEERACRNAKFVFLVYPGCFVALPCGAMDMSAVYDCGIS